VSGHGIAAALIASMVKMSFHSAIASWQRPDLVLKKINAELYGKIGTSFVSAAYLCFHLKEKKCAIAQAGHPPLLVHNRKNGRIKKYKPRGFPLGVNLENRIERKVFEFNSDDRFLLCTDGLYDTLDQMYPQEEVKVGDILKSIQEVDSPEEALRQISLQLELPRPDARDDITMIIVDPTPAI